MTGSNLTCNKYGNWIRVGSSGANSGGNFRENPNEGLGTAGGLELTILEPVKRIFFGSSRKWNIRTSPKDKDSKKEGAVWLAPRLLTSRSIAIYKLERGPKNSLQHNYERRH